MVRYSPAKRRLVRARFAAVAAIFLTAAGCTEIDNALARVPVFAFMHESPAFDPYQNPRPAPPGAVPFETPLGVILPPMEGTPQALDAFAAGPHGQNPFPYDDAAMLELGRVMYDRHCAVCHGVTGLGDGTIVRPGVFPLAPNLVQGPAETQSDGYMYAIIRAGRGLMPAYGARIAHEERWAIVNYVRALQGGGTAPTAAPAQPLPATPADTLPAPAADTAAQDTVTGEETQ